MREGAYGVPVERIIRDAMDFAGIPEFNQQRITGYMQGVLDTMKLLQENTKTDTQGDPKAAQTA